MKKLYFTLIIAIGALMIFKSFYIYRISLAELHQAQESLEYYTALSADRQEEIDYLNSDVFVERYAYESLNMIKPEPILPGIAEQ